ncbi:sulfotransferase [Pseudomonadota bacterium]
MQKIKGPVPSTTLKQAVLLHKQGKTEEANQLYLKVLEADPDNADALHFHGLIEAEKNNYNKALPYLEKSLQLKPGRAPFHHNSAGIFARLGMKEKALHHFQEAIRLQPDYGEAYQGLTECRSFKDDTKLLQQIDNQLKNSKLTDAQRSYMHFAAAKICADSARYGDAFEHYTKGNALKGAKFPAERYQQEIDWQITLFTPEFISSRSEWGLYDHTPIFVLGMPRSGTTLVEQILASHSRIHGAGELNDISSIAKAIEKNTDGDAPYPLCLQRTSQIDLLGFGIEYINRLKRLSKGAERVVNKHPLNFRHIGLILLMFPNAKIIHTVRDPLDTCLSCFFQNFTKGQEYSCNLTNLADFYNGYKRIMQHWESVFPGRIHEIHYENIIADQEQNSRALLEFCSLPWEEGCLSFHETKREVTTASKFQVRRPIYKTSVKRWKNYEKQLQPLIKRLNI